MRNTKETLNQGNLPLHVMGYSDADAYPHYCFDQADQALRISSQGGGIFDAAYDNTIVFQGRHVARDVRITFLKKRRVNLHVETIEILDTAKESAFAVPPNAVGPR